MERSLARFLSYLFHPLIMPTVGIFLFFQLGTFHSYSVPEKAIYFLYLMIFLNTFMIPAGLAFFMYRKGLISSMHLKERKERLMPFFFAFLFYTFNYISLKRTNLPWPVYSLMMGCALAVLVTFLVSFKWKISIHMVGIGGVMGGLYGISQIMYPNSLLVMSLLIFTALGAGLLGFARLKLDAHSQAQIYAGFVVGFLCEFFPVVLRLT